MLQLIGWGVCVALVAAGIIILQLGVLVQKQETSTTVGTVTYWFGFAMIAAAAILAVSIEQQGRAITGTLDFLR